VTLRHAALYALARESRPVSVRGLGVEGDRSSLSFALLRLYMRGHVSRVLLGGAYRYSITDEGRAYLADLEAADAAHVDAAIAARAARVAR
jgi:hypothetical protein